MAGIPYVRSGTGAQIEGIDKLLDKLNDMTTPTRMRRVALKAIEPGAKIMRDAIRSEAPVAEKDTTGRYAHKKGALKRGVRYKASRQNVQYGGHTFQGPIIAYMVGPFGKGTAQRHLVVGGHKIVGHNVHGTFQGRNGVKKGLATEGARTKPNPFVQRGIDKSRDDAMHAVESKASEALEILANG